MGNKVINTTSVKLQIYGISSDSQLAGMVGDVKEMEDGRKFRLCENSTGTLVPAKLVQSHADTAYTEDIVITTAGAVGGKTVTVTNFSGHEALSANELKDGYFCCGAGTNEIGHGRKIKENTAAAANAACTLTFYDKLTAAMTISTSTGAWTYPLFKEVVIDAGDSKVIGCPVCDVTASTSTTKYYFWAQVAGPCPVVAGGAIVRADHLMSNGDGTVIAATGTTPEIVGIAMQSFDSGDAGWVFLTLV